MTEFPEVKEVRRVALGPEDRLVVSLDHWFTEQEFNVLKAQVEQVFGLEPARVILISGLDDLAVVGPRTPERAALEDLLALILDEKEEARLRDVQALGDTAEEEARVDRKIEKLALQLRRDLFENQPSG